MTVLKTASLTPEVLHIICDKGTEAPFVYHLEQSRQQGSYLCRQCGSALFRTQMYFVSHCGWPSFDSEVKNAIKEMIDSDGQRTEIVCRACEAHLGHVFRGEGLTDKNCRYCVNAQVLDFVTDEKILTTEEGIFAAGCFWGVEYYFQKLPGVLKTEVGYIGGNVPYPTYEMICQKNTGHVEAVRVVFDPTILTYQKLAQYFFEIHDPTQKNGQGPDIGEQYISKIFYFTEEQKKIVEALISSLKKISLDVETKINVMMPFWPAEKYHQQYYEKNHHVPYCHHYQKRF